MSEGSDKKTPKSFWKALNREVTVPLIMALLVIQFLVQSFKIPSGSMENSLLVGDFLLGLKFVYGAPIPFTDKHLPAAAGPKPGDVIIFHYPLDPDIPGRDPERFKLLADKKKVITDADLEALIADELYQPRELFQLDGLQVACGTMGMPTATVRLRDPQGLMHVEAAIGTGPVDATFKAMNMVVQCPNVLQEFVIHAVTEGIDALGEVTVRIQSENQTLIKAQSDSDQARTYGGYGADTDIIVASAKAYLAALNKLLVASGQYGEPETPAAEGITVN